MSTKNSKFFTWTKGDRHSVAELVRSGRVVPVPIEYISIKGMEYTRSQKASSKASNTPPPLDFEPSPTSSSRHSSRTNDSSLLHDAALKSATSLITVMNDMLCSPQLSGRFSYSRDRSSGIADAPPRSRAYTAPSTPAYELASPDPVELPGSIPNERKPCLPPPNRTNNRNDRPFEDLSAKKEHQTSSPQQKIRTSTPRCSRKSIESFYREEEFPPPPQTPPPRTDSRTFATAEDHPPGYMEDEPQSHQTYQATTIQGSSKRPPLCVLPLADARSSSSPTPVRTRQSGSTPIVTHIDSVAYKSASGDQVAPTTAAESSLTEQVTGMRAFHEAHVASLKEAHKQEIASLRSYLRFVEGRQASDVGRSSPSQHMAARPPNHAADYSQSLQRSSTSIDSLTTFTFQAATSCSGVKSKDRSFSEETGFETGSMGLRRNSYQIRHDSGTAQVQDSVFGSKVNEAPLTSTIADLEARVLAADTERNDLLVAFQESSRRVQFLERKVRTLTLELNDARRRELSSSAQQRVSSSTHEKPVTSPEEVEKTNRKIRLPPAQTPSPLHHSTVEQRVLGQRKVRASAQQGPRSRHDSVLASLADKSPGQERSCLDAHARLETTRSHSGLGIALPGPTACVSTVTPSTPPQQICMASTVSFTKPSRPFSVQKKLPKLPSGIESSSTSALPCPHAAPETLAANRSLSEPVIASGVVRPTHRHPNSHSGSPQTMKTRSPDAPRTSVTPMLNSTSITSAAAL